MSAQVHYYEYPPLKDSQDLDALARDFLRCLAHELPRPGSRQRPLHFAAYSTGGNVVRVAMTMGGESANRDENSVVESCFSLAFFGVPR